MREREMHCAICNKVTMHTQAFEASSVFRTEASPWMCINNHPDDGTNCHCCGTPLSEQTIKLSRALGATKISCGKCNKPSKPKFRS